jgi:hypothetical protein
MNKFLVAALACSTLWANDTSGTDSPECGSIDGPCNTIGHGVAIFGGFGLAGWPRSAVNVTEITGGPDASSGRYQAVEISGVSIGLFDLTLSGPEASGSSTDPNSYVVFAETGSGLTIERISLFQGNGGHGDQLDGIM